MWDSERVLTRYLIAAVDRQLVREYGLAVEALRKGDIQPFEKIKEKIEKIMIPDGPEGGLPPWGAALSTPKRNSLRTLYQGLHSVSSASKAQVKVEPARWFSYLSDMAGNLTKNVRTLEIASSVGTASIPHGAFSVIPIPGVTQRQVADSLAALDTATNHIRQHFPSVLYGNIYLAKHLQKNTAAWYAEDQDALSVNVAAKKRHGDVFTICHELGHRHAAKFLAPDLKKQFWHLSTTKTYETIEFNSELREKVAKEGVALAVAKMRGAHLSPMSRELEVWCAHGSPLERPGAATTKFLNLQIGESELHEILKGRKDVVVETGKVLANPLHVTPYGATNPGENYADAFAKFCLGEDLPPAISEILSKAR